ncbi:MAG TPA: hypothetical protein VFX92_06345 [Candidatus Krumholzibacteria bacterium]|nr:hypothetical protein [Candidatus Krumholzibacteria bacterium]
MLDFASQEEIARAMLAMVRYLPALVRAFEAGVIDLGLTITERALSRDAEGTVLPTLVVKGGHLTYHLGLRNAIEDFLAVDREARPVHVDPGLDDDTYAQAKIADIISGRLALVKLVEESSDLAEAQQRMKDLGKGFAWLRSVVVDGPENVERPVCKLVGTDGNVFAVIGRVRETLQRAGQTSSASEFVKRAFAARSYDEVLRLCMEYVEVR